MRGGYYFTEGDDLILHSHWKLCIANRGWIEAPNLLITELLQTMDLHHRPFEYDKAHGTAVV